LALAVVLAFLAVILTLREAEGEEPAASLRSKRPFFPLEGQFDLAEGYLAHRAIAMTA
jgi:hypothetical protein